MPQEGARILCFPEQLIRPGGKQINKAIVEKVLQLFLGIIFIKDLFLKEGEKLMQSEEHSRRKKSERRLRVHGRKRKWEKREKVPRKSF